MAVYFITYKLEMEFQKNIIGVIILPPSYKLTELEIIFSISRKEPRLKQAKTLSFRASEVILNESEDYLIKTYSQKQISDQISGIKL